MADGEAMDDAAFEAAMAAFLHEFNLIEPQKANAVEQSRLKANERRDRYRKKLLTERETLRRQERELSAKLSRLLEAHAKAKEGEKKTNTLALSAWRATAARQKEKRLEAEELQQQLKSAVLCRAELVRHMSALLMKPVPMKSLTCTDQVAQGALLFKTFIGELDSMHIKTDECVRGKECKLLPPEKWNQDRTLLESANATVLPFGYEQTWHALSSVLLSDSSGRHYTGQIDDPDNTAAITYRLNYTLELGDTATLVVYSVLRRYIEKDRVVFVWRVLSEGQDEFDGLYSDEHAWLVIRPSDSPDGPASRVETYAQLKLMGLDGQSGSSDSRDNRFVKLLRKADEEDIADVKLAMKRLLVDESKVNSDDSDVVIELKL